MNLLSRIDARALGLERYSTGKPCLRGHVADRYVSTYACVACAATQIAEWQAKPENQNRHMNYIVARRAYQHTQGYRAAKRTYNKSAKGKATFRRMNIKRRVRKLALPYVEHETPMPANGLCPHCDVKMVGEYPAPNTP